MPELRLKRRARESLAKLPPHVQEEIDEALLRVQANPRDIAEPLEGSLAGLWRMVVGSYRVLYRILPPDDRVVIVVSIRHRAAGYPRHRET